MFKKCFFTNTKKKEKCQLRGLLKRCCRKTSRDGFICNRDGFFCEGRVGGCDTVFKVRTGNALRFFGFGCGLMTEKTFREWLCLKEPEVSVDSQGLCAPLKTWGRDNTGSVVQALPPSSGREQLLAPRVLPGQAATEDTGHISAADGQDQGRERAGSCIANVRCSG